MTILEELLESLPGENVPVRHVLVGAHWTVVCSRHAGMAATLMAEEPHAHSRVREVGRLQEKPAQALAGLARSENPLEASIGIAAINSLLDIDESRAQELNAAEVLAEHGRDRTVAIVGHFPFIEKLRPVVGQLWVIELHPIEGEYPAESAADLLPKAEVVAITGSAVINHTLDGLLALCDPTSTVMVLGPSTPLSSVLFSHGAGILSGTHVVDEAAVLRTVAQGATFSQVEGARRLTLVKESTT
jgi:uncharacterized protein